MLSKIATLKSWRERGILDGVVYSTWHNDLGRHPEVMSALDGLESVIVELEPPILRTVGHTIHQSKTLFYALQATPSDAMVLKLRPDLGPLRDHIEAAITASDLHIELKPGWPSVFNNKIMVAPSFFDSPYYLNDIIFYGSRNDLLQLANFDLSTEFISINTAPEQFFFRAPFWRHFPIIDSYLQIYPHYPFGNELAGQARINALIGSDFFLDVFATYVRILDSYFRVGLMSDLERSQNEDIPDGFNVRELFTPVQTPGLQYNTRAQGPVLCDERPLKALLQRRFERDALGLRMEAALERTADPAYQRRFQANPLAPEPEARELADQLAGCVPGLLNRLDTRRDEAGRRFLVRGVSDRISLTIESKETERLAEEINFLRRKLDGLNA